MAAHGARRLAPMLRNATSILGIEALAAAQGCDFHRPLESSPALERVRALIREHVPALEEDRYLHPDLNTGAKLIDTGALIDAAGSDILPRITRLEGAS